MLDRDALISQMRAVNAGRKVNMSMVEDQMKNDREHQQKRKKMWRKRWTLCCACNCILAVLGSGAAVVHFAVGAWSLLCDECDFPARTQAGAAIWRSGKVVVVGGTDLNKNFADVWEGSADGEDWQQLTDVASFGPRHGHALLCDLQNGGTLYVMGGDMAGVNGMPLRTMNDVWASVDGKLWKREIGNAGWSPRKNIGAAIDGKGILYVTGGRTGHGKSGMNDVWKSIDGGRTWTALTYAAPWTGRHGHAFVRLPGGARYGRLYVIGGSDGRVLHDVWASDDDGVTWAVVTFTHVREMRYNAYEERAPWTPRSHIAAVADKNGLLTMTGGSTHAEGNGRFTNEVWQLPSPPSTDVEWYEKKVQDDRLNTAFPPLEWSQASTPQWTERHGHSMFIDSEGVPHIVGGQDADGVLNDMWKMETSIDPNNLVVVGKELNSKVEGFFR